MGPTWYVKYVKGSGTMLQNPLSEESGKQFSFKAGIVYEIGSYSDMLRLTEDGDFIEVDQQGNPKAYPHTAAVAVGEPVTTPKKSRSTNQVSVDTEGDNN